MKETVNEAKMRFAKEARDKDVATSTEVVVAVEKITVKGKDFKKGDKVKVTDFAKDYLLNTNPPSIEEVKK